MYVYDSDSLLDMASLAEDADRDVFISYWSDSGLAGRYIVEYVEIDGDVFENDSLQDEIAEGREVERDQQFLERMWRE